MTSPIAACIISRNAVYLLTSFPLLPLSVDSFSFSSVDHFIACSVTVVKRARQTGDVIISGVYRQGAWRLMLCGIDICNYRYYRRRNRQRRNIEQKLNCCDIRGLCICYLYSRVDTSSIPSVSVNHYHLWLTVSLSHSTFDYFSVS